MWGLPCVPDFSLPRQNVLSSASPWRRGRDQYHGGSYFWWPNSSETTKCTIFKESVIKMKSLKVGERSEETAQWVECLLCTNENLSPHSCDFVAPVLSLWGLEEDRQIQLNG